MKCINRKETSIYSYFRVAESLHKYHQSAIITPTTILKYTVFSGFQFYKNLYKNVLFKLIFPSCLLISYIVDFLINQELLVEQFHQLIKLYATLYDSGAFGDRTINFTRWILWNGKTRRTLLLDFYAPRRKWSFLMKIENTLALIATA